MTVGNDIYAALFGNSSYFLQHMGNMLYRHAVITGNIWGCLIVIKPVGR